MKTKIVNFRLSPVEYERYKEMIDSYGMDISNYVRNMLFINHNEWEKRRKKCSKIGK